MFFFELSVVSLNNFSFAFSMPRCFWILINFWINNKTPVSFRFCHSLNALNDVASAGEDYVNINTLVTFTPFTVSQTRTVTVEILPDNLVELDETFELNLAIPSGSTSLAQLGNQPNTTVTIMDDDSKLSRLLIKTY